MEPVGSLDWILLALALLGRGLCIAFEDALAAVGRARAGELAEARRSGARSLVKVKAEPEKAAGALRAGAVTGLAVAAAMVGRIAAGATPYLLKDFAPAPGMVLGAVLVSAVALAMLAFVTDVLARSLAAARPEAWALRCAPWALLAGRIFGPGLTALKAVADALLRPLGTRGRFLRPQPPLEDLEAYLAQQAQVKAPGAPQAELIHSIFKFGQRNTKDIMIPRTAVVGLDISTAPEEVVRILTEEGHTRMPVFEGDLDHIKGILHAKDVIGLIHNPALIVLADLLRPVHFVPWSKPIDVLMREMQRAKSHIAMVVDEYGGVMGLVTLEDIIEQIVGEIGDEFDVEEREVDQLPDGSAMVAADMRIADFNKAFDAAVPEDDGFETMAGFLNYLAGSIPSVGDRFFYQGLEFTVTRRDERRVHQVRVARTSKPEPKPAERVQ